MNVLLAMRDAVSQGILWAVLTIGAFVSYKVLHFADLSVDGSFALGGAISARLIVGGVNPFLAMLVSMLAGTLAGMLTGLLHTKLKIPGLLSGILTMLALYSINIRIMGKPNTSLLGENTLFNALDKLLPLSRVDITLIFGVVFCIILITLTYCFMGTEIGCALRATGDNERMACALGVNTSNMMIIGLMLSNGLVALSGSLVAQNQGFADVGMGTGAMVIGLASIIIGEVLFRFMRRSFALKLVVVVLGSIIYRVIIAVVLQIGLNANDLKLLSAMLVVVALTTPLVRIKLKTYSMRKASQNR